MTITTGSNPAALFGGTREAKPTEPPGAKTSEPKAGGGSYDADFMRGMEEGYNPRKAMAAGIVKC